MNILPSFEIVSSVYAALLQIPVQEFAKISNWVEDPANRLLEGVPPDGIEDAKYKIKVLMCRALINFYGWEMVAHVEAARDDESDLDAIGRLVGGFAGSLVPYVVHGITEDNRLNPIYFVGGTEVFNPIGMPIVRIPEENGSRLINFSTPVPSSALVSRISALHTVLSSSGASFDVQEAADRLVAQSSEE